ncbi:MAG: PRC-barrel domain-containing protein, partial [Pseudomonadota bacterium]
DRSVLPDDGEEDEFYHADLIGLEIRDDKGAAIGRIVAVHNFGGGDILDVTLAGRKGVLIPFTQAAVPEVSIAEGFVRVDPVAAGLVEDEDGEAARDEGFDPKGRPRGPKDAGGNR